MINFLHHVIRWTVKFLSCLMVLVIIWGAIDVVFVMYETVIADPIFLIGVNEMFTLFSSFMVVLIAIEIFINIRLYLGTSVLPVQLVIATALMAIARKVIVLDVEAVDASYLAAMGLVILALGLTYWLLARKTKHASNKSANDPAPKTQQEEK
ncbi:MAG: phosphate-starvation-inducible PsiE family protein [Idiomarina sp.]|nr:phosphate-starvation-inducible PsiE family protein [Idiomarina sp.]